MTFMSKMNETVVGLIASQRDLVRQIIKIVLWIIAIFATFIIATVILVIGDLIFNLLPIDIGSIIMIILYPLYWILTLAVFLRLERLIPKEQAQKIIFHSFLLLVSAVIASIFFIIGSLIFNIIGINEISIIFLLLSPTVTIFVYIAILKFLGVIKQELAKPIFLVLIAIALASIEASLLIFIEVILFNFKDFLFAAIQFIIIFGIAYILQEKLFGVSGAKMFNDWWGELTQKQRDVITAYLFMTPSFTSLILFVFFPVFFAALMSFFKNPTVLELRFAADFYTNLANVSMASLRKFFVANVEGVYGIFMNNGLFAIFTVLLMLTYIYLGYKILSKTYQQPRPVIAGFVVVSSLIIIPLLMFFLVTFFDRATFLSVPIKLPIDEYRVVLTSIELDFVRVLFNTVFWTLACTVLHVLLGMFLAILMNRDFGGKSFFRSIFILPWAIPSFVSTLVWRAFIFDRNQGLLGRITANATGTEGFSFTVLDLFTIIAVIGLIVSAFIFVNQRIKGDKLYRSMVSLGLALISIVLAIILSTAFDVIWGITQIENLLPLLGIKIVDIPSITSTFWYTDDIFLLGFRFKMITFSAILVNVWLGVPFMMISFLAALQSIPVDLYEAAEIDGATGWQKFRKITLPLLKPTLMTVSLLGIIWTFNLFNVVYLLSQNQTGLSPAYLYDIFVTFIYDRFENQEYSRASALSFIVFVMLISFSFVYRRVMRAEAIFEGESENGK
ncbi:MAG: carbohydrate ABC transporter permease [Candidatus Hodarchaeota archaeon]